VADDLGGSGNLGCRLMPLSMMSAQLDDAVTTSETINVLEGSGLSGLS
jgi:hypothetical protein